MWKKVIAFKYVYSEYTGYAAVELLLCLVRGSLALTEQKKTAYISWDVTNVKTFSETKPSLDIRL